MNVGSDIAQLSYKELQALALRYRIPGNIKKKVLVKVLQAARNGNDAEYYRLLHELRKTRKKKTRKSKNSKLGITSTPLHSPDYIMAEDNYYYQQQPQQPQQQSPYQWCFPFLQIGAEEEIANKEDPKVPHYEEFKHFLLKRIQREFQACDSNNNRVEDRNFMDRRTTPMSPNFETTPLVEPSYPKVNLNSDPDPLASSNDRSSYQVVKEEPEGGSQGSFLLKRMLQAPVGANLGEIASSVFWASNPLDNSDTLTAESESNENEDQLDANTNEYYNVPKNSKDEFMLNEANLMPQQVSNVLPTGNQYRFSGDMDTRANSYQNWAIASVMEVPDGNLQSSKVFHAIYYNNTDSSVTVANADNNLGYQYQTEAACNDGQNFFNANFDAQDTNYTTGTDIIANDPSDIYYPQNFSKHNEEMSTGYFRNVDTFEQNNMQQNVYTNDQQYQYLYPRFTQETNNLLNERFEQPQSNLVAGKIIENSINQEINTENLQSPANGTVEKFWPKWSPEPNNNLENILDYPLPKEVDNSKLSQTSCVYCHKAPIISQRFSLAINGCTIERKYTAEPQHSFSHSMVYNDTSQGMRMTNVHDNPLEQSMSTYTTIMTNSDDLKEIVNNATINDVWMNQYEPSYITDDMNMQMERIVFFESRSDNEPRSSSISKLSERKDLVPAWNWTADAHPIRLRVTRN